MKSLAFLAAALLVTGARAGTLTLSTLDGTPREAGRAALDVEEHPAWSPDEALDALDRALTVSSPHGLVHARVSGLLDYEQYAFSRPAPALIYGRHAELSNPRLSGFLDIDAGPNFYAFAQGRVDRGFDPADKRVEARLDEYFVRWTAINSLPFTLAFQAGKFATVVGGWVPRHLSWDNPFINAPLPYENVTSAADTDEAPSAFVFGLFRGFASGKYEWVPVIWGPSYASGLAMSGQVAGHFDFAIEVKNAALSSRPETWDGTQRGWGHPTVSGRLGWRPGPDWNLGVSGSTGSYLTDNAAPLPAGDGFGDYWQTTFVQDVAYAHGHWQLWAEAMESRFEVPFTGNADTFAYYVESRFKVSPGLWLGLRWNQQLFGKIPDGFGGEVTWGNDLWRTDLALGYRWSEHFQAKVQYSYGREHDDPGGERSVQLGAVQLTTKF